MDRISHRSSRIATIEMSPISSFILADQGDPCKFLACNDFFPNAWWTSGQRKHNVYVTQATWRWMDCHVRASVWSSLTSVSMEESVRLYQGMVPLAGTSESNHMWPWTTKKLHGCICRHSQQYGYVNNILTHNFDVWVKIIDFSFMPKIIRILSKDHVPWRYFVNFLP